MLDLTCLQLMSYINNVNTNWKLRNSCSLPLVPSSRSQFPEFKSHYLWIFYHSKGQQNSAIRSKA